MGENQTIQVGNDMQVSYEALKADIMQELREAGAKEIPSVYNGFGKIVDVLEEYIVKKDKHEREIKRIRARYSQEVAMEKVKNLNVEMSADETILKMDMDTILNDHIKYKQTAIKNAQAKAEYKTARSEAIDIILKLGDKLEGDLVGELIKPLVEAKDLTTLRILQKTKSKENSYTYSSAIREVEAYLSNDDIIQAVNEAKKYINVPAKGISIAFASAVNRNDVKAYEKLKNMK